MKNKLMVLALAGALSVASLMGCGNVPTDAGDNGGVSVMAGKEQAANSITNDESSSEETDVSAGEESTFEKEITPVTEEASLEESLSEALLYDEPSHWP